MQSSISPERSRPGLHQAPSDACRSADFQSAVSQVSNLRILANANGPGIPRACRLEVGDTAGWKPALRGAANRSLMQPWKPSEGPVPNLDTFLPCSLIRPAWPANFAFFCSLTTDHRSLDAHLTFFGAPTCLSALPLTRTKRRTRMPALQIPKVLGVGKSEMVRLCGGHADGPW